MTNCAGMRWFQALEAVTKLKQGRDYSGTGSSIDPIIFRGPLHYYPAFYQYCEQEDLDPATRQLQVLSGVLYDVLCHSACNFDPLSRGIGVQN
jgi:hypothetical protein